MKPIWSDERIERATSGRVEEIEMFWHKSQEFFLASDAVALLKQMRDEYEANRQLNDEEMKVVVKQAMQR